MRRVIAANWTIALTTIALTLSLSMISAVQAAGPASGARPQAKIIVYRPPGSTPATVAVMGQVRSSGTYQFPSAPTLNDAVQAAQGLKPEASPMVRIVRGNRVAQRVSFPTAAHEKLLTGDLVIIDTQPIRDHSPQARAAEPAGVQLALLGIAERPVVVLVKPWQAKAETIIQMLGQSPAAMTLQVLPPPNARRDPSGLLPDGSVLVFDSRRINFAELPDDLPKIVQCKLPEPDIGGYGVHHAIQERHVDPTPQMIGEGAIPWTPSPQPDDLKQVPLPPLDANSQASPTLIPDDRLPARFSTSEAPSSISRVPFATRSTSQPARLTSVPSATNAAADVQEPAWNKVASSNTAQALDADAELAGEPSAARGMSLLQIIGILTGVALIGGLVMLGGGLAIAMRGVQETASQHRSHRDRSASDTFAIADKIRLESSATIPAPHIPLGSFATAAAASVSSRPAIIPESREVQEHVFRGILKNELPLAMEPLALRPGLKISLPHDEGAIRRVDDQDSAMPAPHRSPAPAPHIAAASGGRSSERHIVDQPHVGHMPAPHLRTGTEAPVERALRHLHGDNR